MSEPYQAFRIHLASPRTALTMRRPTISTAMVVFRQAVVSDAWTKAELWQMIDGRPVARIARYETEGF
jgi:hypothetical protein